MKAFITYAMLLASLSVGVPFAQAQMTSQPKSKGNSAEEEIRRFNVEEPEASSIRTQRRWRDCGPMISLLPIP